MISVSRRRLGDRGQITVLMLPIIAALIAIAGLVIDGGAALAARQQAASLAEQAARLGADQLDQASLRRPGPATVDGAAASTAVRGYLAAQGRTGQVGVAGSTVTVTVTISRRTSLLQLVGIRTLTVAADASARSVGGISTVEDPR